MSKVKKLFRDIGMIMRWQLAHTNWTAVVMWIGGALLSAFFYVMLVMAFTTMFGSCATKKELHEHQTHTVEADTLATEAKTDVHTTKHDERIDSLVTASIWAAMQEFVKSEQEHETTTETLTETIDSLGRIIRQQQRTTDRTVSRQELQRQQEQLQQISTDLRRHVETLDSAWADRMTRFESHLRDSLATTIDRISETNTAPALTWWQKLWQQWKGFLAGVVICSVLFITRRFWQKWLPIKL